MEPALHDGRDACLPRIRWIDRRSGGHVVPALPSSGVALARNLSVTAAPGPVYEHRPASAGASCNRQEEVDMLCICDCLTGISSLAAQVAACVRGLLKPARFPISLITSLWLNLRMCILGYIHAGGHGR